MKLIPRFTVKITLEDILYLSYLIPTARVRPHVPAILRLAEITEGNAFVSVVALRSRDVRVSYFPSLTFSYDQLNIRTYVIDPFTGNHGVFFMKSGITSKGVHYLTRLLQVPWETIEFQVKAQRDTKDMYQYYLASGNWKEDVHIEAKGERSSAGSLYPFEDQVKMINYLTGPSIGFFSVSGKTFRFEVQHSEIKPTAGVACKVRIPFLISSGLLKENEIEKPHSLLLASRGEFLVFMPARRIDRI